ncbi:MAG TPA: hypothetical protein VF589_07810 [Allosphingosinicella sp.]|jgi:hypothetical protein
MKFSALLAASALLVAGPAAASGKEEIEKANPSNRAAERICKRWIETGSRLTRTRVCATRAEWQAISDEQQKMVAQHQQNKRTIDSQLGRDAYQQCLRC